MNCQNCGANLEEGVVFCRECGNKIEKKKIFCRECGAKIEETAKFCSECGANVNFADDIIMEDSLPQEEVHVKESLIIEKIVEETPDLKSKVSKKNNATQKQETDNWGDKIKTKLIEFWKGMDILCKMITIMFVVVIVHLLASLLVKKEFAVAISVLQIIGLLMVTLIHKEIIKLSKKYVKYIILGIVIIFIPISILSCSSEAKMTNEDIESTAEQIEWTNITLSHELPKPQSNIMNILYNGKDWLNVNIHDFSQNDYLQYVRWCKEDYGFTINGDSFDNYFYAFNQKGYCLTLFYDEKFRELNIDLQTPTGDITENAEKSKKEHQSEQNKQVEEDEKNAFSITKGTEYAYMTDEWNVYIATAISDNIIKIENWSKTMSSSKSVSYDYDVGTFKINDSENKFAWIDDECTAFVIKFKDKNNRDFKNGSTAIFTINISDSDENKGSNYSEEIASYSYQNDDWHLYRAIPLTEDIIKIETWYRGSSLGNFLFGYDLCLIDTTSGETDFEWTDDEHTSFSITMQDEKNKYEWKKDTLVVYELEKEDYMFFDVNSYLDIWEVGEDEVAVPKDASDYQYQNYQDVKSELEEAGFANITTTILYDIVWGWTDEGEVKSVSIDGRTDYKKGEAFKKDVPIVITYHMKEEDNPDRQSESTELKDSTIVEKTTELKENEKPEETSSLFYSTNDYETAKKGNSGVFSYKERGGSYDIYWIIDFDEGYVYYFTDGNEDTTCDRLKIDSGDLNTYIEITYHAGEDTWSNKLHFKYMNHPETLIMVDNDGFEYEYSTTDLGKALALRNTKTVKDY